MSQNQENTAYMINNDLKATVPCTSIHYHQPFPHCVIKKKQAFVGYS